MKLTIPKNIARFAGAALFAAVAVSTARADYYSTIQSNTPVGYWLFNETTASSPLNLITNAIPLTGGLGTGYVVPDTAVPLLGQPGLIGPSIRFSNPGNVIANANSKIDAPWYALNNTLPPFSVEFWCQPTSLGVDSTGSSPISNFDPDYNGEATRDGWLFYMSSTGVWNFRIGSHSGYAASLVATNGNAVVGSWEHIVGTWDGLSAKVYVNGVLVGGKYATVSGAAPGNNPPFYGNSHSIIRFGGTQLNGTGGVTPSAISPQAKNGNRGYDGYLQQVAIYTNALTPAQIGAHYMAASTNNAGYTKQILADGPVSYWTMNDAPVAAPTSPYPQAVNSGTLGSAANLTNFPGSLAAVAGPGYPGFGTATNSVFYNGVSGYSEVDQTAGLHFSGQVTLAAWVKPIEQDFYRTIIAHGYDYFQAETFLRIDTYDSSIQNGTFYEIGSSDGQTYYDSAIYQVPAGDIGNWVFIVGTYDGSNWNLYRNGQLVATLPPEDQGGTGAIDVTNKWTIGSRGVDGSFVGQGSFFGGNIFAPAIFTNALSAAQVQALYYAALVPPVITQAPTNPGTLFEGSSFTLSVLAEGNPTLAYQWQFADFRPDRSQLHQNRRGCGRLRDLLGGCDEQLWLCHQFRGRSRRPECADHHITAYTGHALCRFSVCIFCHGHRFTADWLPMVHQRGSGSGSDFIHLFQPRPVELCGQLHGGFVQSPRLGHEQPGIVHAAVSSGRLSRRRGSQRSDFLLALGRDQWNRGS